MKGTKEMPVCGFSKTVVSVLDHYGVDFHDVNILGHEDMRPALAELSGWPTFPQLFVNGKLLGGCDITVEMHENGQLFRCFRRLNKVYCNNNILVLYFLRFWPVRLVVRTHGFHPCNRGSIPLRAASFS